MYRQQHQQPVYDACQRNITPALGGHSVDGCGEFVPADPDDPLHCDACSCHRSFHRKDLLACHTASSAGGGAGKRRRTNYSSELKVKMLELAETVGWKFQSPQADEAIKAFCTANGIEPHVLVGWLKHNKQLKKNTDGASQNL